MCVCVYLYNPRRPSIGALAPYYSHLCLCVLIVVRSFVQRSIPFHPLTGACCRLYRQGRTAPIGYRQTEKVVLLPVVVVVTVNATAGLLDLFDLLLFTKYVRNPPPF